MKKLLSFRTYKPLLYFMAGIAQCILDQIERDGVKAAAFP